MAPPFARTYIGGERIVRVERIWASTNHIAWPAKTTVPVYNNDGTPRRRKILVSGVPTSVPVSQNIPTYRELIPEATQIDRQLGIWWMLKPVAAWRSSRAPARVPRLVSASHCAAQ